MNIFMARRRGRREDETSNIDGMPEYDINLRGARTGHERDRVKMPAVLVTVHRRARRRRRNHDPFPFSSARLSHSPGCRTSPDHHSSPLLSLSQHSLSLLLADRVAVWRDHGDENPSRQAVARNVRA